MNKVIITLATVALVAGVSSCSMIGGFAGGEQTKAIESQTHSFVESYSSLQTELGLSYEKMSSALGVNFEATAVDASDEVAALKVQCDANDKHMELIKAEILKNKSLSKEDKQLFQEGIVALSKVIPAQTALVAEITTLGTTVKAALDTAGAMDKVGVGIAAKTVTELGVMLPADAAELAEVLPVLMEYAKKQGVVLPADMMDLI